MDARRLFLFASRSLAARFFLRAIPANVMVSVTNRCQSGCCYCRIPQRSGGELSCQNLCSLIDEITRLGCVRLGLWGGEPLIRDDIGTIIDYAKTKRLWVTMDSNGYLLPDKIAQVKKLDHLLLSFDGPEDAHDANRGKGSFGKVMAAMDAARGRIPFWTITVLTTHNLDSIDYIIGKATDMGFLACFQLLHHNDILGRNHESLLPERNKCRQAIQKLIAAKRRGAPIGSSLSYLHHILSWDDYGMSVSSARAGRSRCWAGKLYCNVDTDGTVYPCSLLAGKVPGVNYLESGFKKAFESVSTGVCNSCLGACFTEYNYLYSFDTAVIANWIRSMKDPQRKTCAQRP